MVVQRYYEASRKMAEEKRNDAEEPRLKPNDKKCSAESAELGQWATATKRAFVDTVKV